MPFRRRLRRQSGARKLRAREWVSHRFINTTTFVPTVVAFPLATTAVQVYGNYILSPDDMTINFDEPTLMRWILQWSFQTNQSPGADCALSLQLGLIKLSLEGATAPFNAGDVARIPLPFDDGDSAWIWQSCQTIVLRVNEKTTILSGSGGEQLNIKTRRKVENGEGLAMVAVTQMETPASSGTVGWLSFSGRLLLLNR